jgi:hypothetical protein
MMQIFGKVKRYHDQIITKKQEKRHGGRAML